MWDNREVEELIKILQPALFLPIMHVHLTPLLLDTLWFSLDRKVKYLYLIRYKIRLLAYYKKGFVTTYPQKILVLLFPQ